MDEFGLSENALGCQRRGPHVLVRLQDAVEHVGGVEGAAFGTCGVRQDLPRIDDGVAQGRVEFVEAPAV